MQTLVGPATAEETGRCRADYGASVLLRQAARITFVISILVPTFACTIALEPPYDETIVDGLEILTAKTSGLFVRIQNGVPVTNYHERAEIYEDLAARAATIKLYAEARPAPSGGIASMFTATPTDSEEGQAGEDPSDNATSGYMLAYLSNLKRLADKDREAAEAFTSEVATFKAEQDAYSSALEAYQSAYLDWVVGRGPEPETLGGAPIPPSGGVSANFVERRRVLMEDILRDALVYERGILDRNR